MAPNPTSDNERTTIADKWAGEPCLLNGQRAKIIGRRLRFGLVAELDSPYSVEYSWDCIDRIMSTTRCFAPSMGAKMVVR